MRWPGRRRRPNLSVSEMNAEYVKVEIERYQQRQRLHRDWLMRTASIHDPDPGPVGWYYLYRGCA